MNKEKWKERLGSWKEKLAFLRPWDLEEDVGEDLEIREMELSNERTTGRVSRWDERQETPEEQSRNRLYLLIGLGVLVAVVFGAFFYYSGHHVFHDYVVTSTVENLDIDGTHYVMLGNTIAKYSSDGVFCVDSKNQTKWSAAYSMQTPIIDVCEKTMVIAEQQGNQVYVLNTAGILGSFNTELPIMKIQVSKQGVVAALLKDKEAAWIMLFDSVGNEIAKIKATLTDSGYPLDMAFTSNAKKMMVSYLGEEKGKLRSRIAFYDFSSASDKDESHLTGTIDYIGRTFPEVYYADDTTPVAVADDGFVVFKNSKVPDERESVTLDHEIVSCFYDDEYVGFVFNNEAADCRYEMEIYRYNGKRTAKHEFDCDYSEVKLDNGEILLYDAKNLSVYSLAGNQRFGTDYEKQVAFFANIPGFRKYLVITNDSMDRIRIK